MSQIEEANLDQESLYKALSTEEAQNSPPAEGDACPRAQVEGKCLVRARHAQAAFIN